MLRRPGSRRQRVGREPAGLGELAVVCDDLAAGPARGEADHERAGERPRLAAEVAHVVDRDPGLLVDLAGDGLLERLADLDEPGERAEERHPRARVAGEQRAAIALDEGDHRRRQARVGAVAAARAQPHALGRRAGGGAAAPAAPAVIAVPRGEAERAAGDPEVVVVERAEQLAERDGGGAGRRWLAVGEDAREARRAIAVAEEQPVVAGGGALGHARSGAGPAGAAAGSAGSSATTQRDWPVITYSRPAVAGVVTPGTKLTRTL